MFAPNSQHANSPYVGSMKGDEPVMPIAIVGLGGRFPGDAANPEKLWDMISKARSALTEVPKDRFNVDAFYHPYNERSGAINVRGGHYMDRDIAAFDAPFFSITPNEAKAMDPQQRMALECAYEAMENAGLRMEDMVGTDTSVYVGSFSKDYSEMMAADQEDLPLYYGTGTGTAILSNRISWFFDFHGPSISIDTACSSALVALHLGCQSLRVGESKTAIVGGVNFMLVPGVMTAMTALGFLSADSKCHSFDEKANGYARGEGASFAVLKPLHQAIQDNDVIRAVIRNTASNQDGNTPGITVPSATSQEELIRKCYADAGLPLSETQYVEAHGTGTQAGDPQETSALSATLAKARPQGDPLLIGSIKTNIGHLEGGSGLAQVTKAVLSLERGEIPPNLWYNKPNARIPMDDWNLAVVQKLTPWPSEGPRRISINSFGYGGANAHVIIDDAYHYLKTRQLRGNHNTQVAVGSPDSVDSGIGIHPADLQPSFFSTKASGWASLSGLDFLPDDLPEPAKLFVYSSNEQSGIERTASLYRGYLSEKLEELEGKAEKRLLGKFARTLASRRSIFPWRAFAVASSGEELCQTLEDSPIKPKRAPKAAKLGFIFTGQGAQWYAMGRELCAYDVFQRSLQDASTHLVQLGAEWSLTREFFADEKTSRINSPAFAQPMCTALQVALVDLLRSWGIKPSAVAGHSSGEIGAAYAKGAISRESAWAISYHRGRLSSNIRGLAPSINGSMLATGLSAEQVKPYVDKVTEGNAVVACKNSPSSTTVSGDSTAIAQLEGLLKDDGHFARRLVVETAYHSPHMHVIADLYHRSISNIKTFEGDNDVKMFSSVTGELIEAKDLSASYWVQNMVSQVEFVGAVQKMLHFSGSKRRANKPYVDVLLELGPHSALQGPLKQILKAQDKKFAEVACFSALQRGKNASATALEALGRLFQHGFPIKINTANQDELGLYKAGYLVDIPPFAWNHNNRYWSESNISKQYRFRSHPRTDLLGAIIPEGNSIEPLFRNIMKLNEIPWVEHHKVQGTILYPAAGMMVMAIEACAQRADTTRTVEGYEIRDAIVGKAIVIPSDDSGTETMLSLRPWRAGSQDLASSWDEFRIFSRRDETWELNCTGLVRAKYATEKSMVFADEEDIARVAYAHKFRAVEAACHKEANVATHYENLATIGLGFSGPFKSLVGVKRGDFKSRCELQIPDTKSLMPHQFEFPHVIHPSTLDCCIQMGLAGATKADENLKVAPIPTSIERLYVSADIPREAGTMLHGTANIHNEGFENAHASFIIFDDKWEKPVVTFDGVKSTALRHGELGFAQAANMRKLAAYFHWQEDIAKLDSEGLRALCSSALSKLGEVPSSKIADLEHAAFIYMKRVMTECPKEEAKNFEPHLFKFYQFMEKTLLDVAEKTIPHMGPDWLNICPEDEDKILKRVAGESHDGAVLCRHGENLVSILRGNTLAIEPLMRDNLLHNWYQSGLGLPQTYEQLTKYVDLLGHKNPDLKILEIGAGTGGATLPVLEALGGRNGASPRFSQYTFTDISTGFFEKAQEKFKPWLPYMKFQKVDISEDPLTQGLKAGEYDLVVAANVLHATTSMDETLTNVKKLMKPTGKLALMEITNPLLRVHMIVGSFEGWWAGQNDGREWGPTMTEATWDKTLSRNGFSGVDLALQDIPNEKDHFYSLMVSTASVQPRDELPTDVIIVEPDTPHDELAAFTQKISEALRSTGATVNVAKLSETAETDVSAKTVVYTLEADTGKHLLPEIDAANWDLLKHLIMTAKNSTWITHGAEIESEDPTANLMTGMARCIRAENPSVSLTTLDFDFDQSIDTNSNVDFFLQILASSEKAIDQARPDWEYAIRHNRILVQRILLENGMNNLLSTQLLQPKPELAPWKQEGRPLELQIGTYGRLDTFRFNDDMDYELPLHPDDVEIEVKGVGLNFMDVMVAMGQIEEKAIGLDCAGIVSRVGPQVKNLKVGDRVMTWAIGAFRTYLRSPECMCVSVPQELDLITAASLPLVYSTAYYSMFDLARLKKGETVLIHGAAGGVGQAAIVLAQHLGAKIFATVSSAAKKQLLIEHFGIDENCIFNSRDESFVSGVMRMTDNKGVDVVLNSLAGEALRRSWHCIAWFGRFVEMGKKDIVSNTGLEMAPFMRNVSFQSVNLVGLIRHDLSKCAEVFQNVMRLLHEGIVKPIDPTTSRPMSELEDAFRLMQTGKHMGKIVLEAHDDDMVPTIPEAVKPIRFSSDSTYLLSGGLGGLGRSIAQWMVRHGARNIVFVSRSGDSKPEAQATLSTLEKDGANVAAFACDIANNESLKTALDQIRGRFPPIKGAIQGAMVLQDAIYQNMTHEQYTQAIRPKVQGSWNLHELLPKDMDFFIFLSSSAGIAGSRGQGNYAAGNAFEDALANHRNRHGLPTSSIDLGMILDVGYVAESQNSDVTANTSKWNFAAIREKELHAMVQASITHESVRHEPVPAQLITGLGTGGMANLAGFQIPWWFNDSKFAHLKAVDTHQVQLETEEDTSQVQTLLSQATSMDAAAEIVSVALIKKIAKSLMVDIEDIEATKPVSRYGVDSLLAVEIRSWIFTEIQADISVFQLLSNVPISQLVKQIVGKSKCVSEAVRAEA
ncbi:MAG: hypothetical protein Q9227_005091 [Pyrenula ochraceoflavens]